MIRVGPLDINRHRFLKGRGVDLHVFVRGDDVTDRCRYADDTPGKQVAVLYRMNTRGRPYLDEDGHASVEVINDDVVIRPLVWEP